MSFRYRPSRASWVPAWGVLGCPGVKRLTALIVHNTSTTMLLSGACTFMKEED